MASVDWPPATSEVHVQTFLYVVGTRPNFMKVAPVLRQMRHRLPSHHHVLVHTGQHYDAEMSQVFFDELGLPRPDHSLGVGSAPPATQTAAVMAEVENLILNLKPQMLVVAGDVNSTLAAALAAAKQRVPVAHIEAGLRSFDRTMPEELNRLLTDQISELLFIHSPEARENLIREGVDDAAVHSVGNTMIDTLVELREIAENRRVVDRLRIEAPYLLVTLHRPALVDGPLLSDVLEALDQLAGRLNVLFPVHPRTREKIEQSEFKPVVARLLPPVGYLDFLALQAGATAVLTDSGGVQEETSFLGVPCFTLRDNTERPITISRGTNTLLGLRPEAIAGIPDLLAGQKAVPAVIDGWDGRAGERIADVLAGAL